MPMPAPARGAGRHQNPEAGAAPAQAPGASTARFTHPRGCQEQGMQTRGRGVSAPQRAAQPSPPSPAHMESEPYSISSCAQ